MRHASVLVFLALLSTSSHADPISAATGVMRREFPSVARYFHFRCVPASKTLAYSYRVHGGQATVEAATAVEMCRGAYDCLREEIGAQLSWSGASIGALNAKVGLPKDTQRKVTSPYQTVLQDNVCTFGYTTAFYGWTQWQHYLDVMALHGITMEFSPVGGEAIWDRVWTKLGISRSDLDNFFTGPAFLPWHRMGNVNKHDGPLPESYKRQSIALEKRILGRMRELGIEPVAPAFAGFVPAGFKKAYPQENVLQIGSWAGFEDGYRTQILHPLSPMYSKIGGAFIHEWHKEFGPAKYYLADSFNELQAPVSADRATRLKELSGFGKAVYDGILAGDPNGTWVMQGWLFFSAHDFWDPESVAALLSPVPNDRMLILDLYAEATPIWKQQNAFYGKSWILSTITTWGGNNQVYGNFDNYRTLSADTWEAPGHGNLVGFGISFEGGESNEAEFELLCDTAWSEAPISLETWLPELVRNRYGQGSADALAAWKSFAKTVYDMAPGIHPNHLLQSRPFELGPASRGSVHDSAEFRRGVKLLLKARKTLGNSKLYQADAIQFSAQAALAEADIQLRDAVLAFDDGNVAASLQSEKRLHELVIASDRLLASHPLDRLDRWVKLARAWGKNVTEKNYYESDAKRQVTVWGGPELSEYAAKMWSGLESTYYAPRWEQWLEAKQTGKNFDLDAWQEKWITTPLGPSVSPFADPLAAAEALVDSLPDEPMQGYARKLQGELVGEWKSGEQNPELESRSWDLSAHVHAPGPLVVRFQYTSGACRLEIQGVELVVDGQVVSTDSHAGRTGLEDVGNTFNLVLTPFNPGQKVELRAKVRSDGGTDSNGQIYIRSKSSTPYRGSSSANSLSIPRRPSTGSPITVSMLPS